MGEPVCADVSPPRGRGVAGEADLQPGARPGSARCFRWGVSGGEIIFRIGRPARILLPRKGSERNAVPKTISKNGIQPPRLPARLEAAQRVALEEDALFEQVRIDGLDFSGQKGKNLAFVEAELRRVNFSAGKIQGIRLSDCQLERCELAAAVWEKARMRRVVWKGCRLTGINLVEAALEDVLFQDCTIEGASFGVSAFKAARFEGCNLREASFLGCDLSGVVFHRCDLSRANLSEATLKGTDLRTAVIDGLRAGSREIQGAIIAPEQAVQVVKLLGVEVREP